MACSSLKQHQQNSFMSPRISFSNGFADAGSDVINASNNSTAAENADFEFCAANYAMNSADELFFNGKMLPLSKDGKGSFGIFNSNKVTTTLRDELLIDDCDASDHDDHNIRRRLPRGSSKGASASGCKWKERFGGFKIKSTLL